MNGELQNVTVSIKKRLENKKSLMYLIPMKQHLLKIITKKQKKTNANSEHINISITH